MAGDWIKFELATPDKPEVWAIAAALNIDPDAVVGKLLRVWGWFDQQTENGNAPSVSKMLLDRLVGVAGFCNAVINADWMIDDGDTLSLPHFDRHNGKTAKNRATTAKRVASFKNKLVKSNDEGNAQVTPTPLPKEEKRREEKIEDQKIITPQAAQPATPEKKSRKTGSRLPDDWRPTQEHVDAAMQLNPDYTREWFSATAHKFRDYWVAKTGKDATKADWLATWRNWVRNDIEYNRGKANAKPKQLDHNNTDWINRAFESPASGQHGEQDFSFIDCDIPSLGCGDQGSGSHEPSQGGMVQGAD
jgi:hypothetical protein